MNGQSCYLTQNNMPHAPFAAQKEGWSSYAHFAASRMGIITIIMDTILMVSIFVILAFVLLHAVLCLTVLAAILAVLMISSHSFIRPKEQP